MESDCGLRLVDAEELYRRYGPMVLRRCRRILRNEDAAADAMQETFVRVLKHKDDLTVAHPSSLLYRIATNVCLNSLRDSRRRPTVSADPLLPLLEGRERLEDRVLDSFTLEQVFAGAREGTRAAAEMLFLEGRTLAETAEEVDLSISGVRKRIRTLREQ
ncbi:MAG TPA: sigma-70 family RNA polymerase sigma factor, partial [Spirochaetia bacterium]|nr:sigma-70 family RNA polymerase sigma factor [Spirochaetia bacterium]